MQSRKRLLFIILAILIGSCGGIFQNVASDSLPQEWQSYLWVAWPIYAALIILTIVVAILQEKSESPSLEVAQNKSHQENKMRFQGNEQLDDDDWQVLHTLLLERARISDLKDICFYVNGLEVDDYPIGKTDFIREMLLDVKARGLGQDFVLTIRKYKPWMLRI